MYVCLCNAVNDRQVTEALGEGKCTLRELRRHLGFQSCCGRCTEFMRGMICHHLAQQAAPPCGAAACDAECP